MHAIYNKNYYKNSRINVSMFVANGVLNDSRVIKTAQTLKKLGFQVTLFGFGSKASQLDVYNFPIHLLPKPQIRMDPKTRVSQRNEAWWEEFCEIGAELLSEEMQRIGSQVLHTHDMFGLAIGGKVLEKISSKPDKWVHDIHEFVEGLSDLDSGVRNFCFSQEKKYILKPDALTTVSPALAGIIKDSYRLKSAPEVILNTPRQSDLDPHSGIDLRSKFNIPKDETLITYIGGVKPIRGLETLIEAMSLIGFNARLAILTNNEGNYIDELKSYVSALGIDRRVIFHPYVPFNCVTSTLASVSIGVHPINRYPNAEVALPNKLFEYMSAGLPIVASDAASMKKFINEYDCGKSFKSGDARELANALDFVANRLKKNSNWSKKIFETSKQFSWEVQERKISDCYKTLVKDLHEAHKPVGRLNSARVLQLPNKSAGQPAVLAKGLSQDGLPSKSLSIAKSNFGYSSDIELDIHSSIETGWPPVMAIKKLSSHFKSFDILHYHSTPVVLKKGYAYPTGLDILAAKLANKKIFYHFRGSEIRMASIFKKVSPFHYVDSAPQKFKKFPEVNQKRFVKYVSAICDRLFVTDPELQTYVSAAVVVPRVIDLDKFPEQTNPLASKRLKVVHAPTDRLLKGSEEIISAVNELKSEGNKIDFELIENMSHSKALEKYKKADIVIDQLRIGWYGVLSMEAMALGKPVIAYIRDDLKHHLPFPLPLAIANPINIKSVLSELLSCHDLRLQLGQRGRDFVKRNHDVHTVSKNLRFIYNQPGSPSKTFDIIDWFQKPSAASKEVIASPKGAKMSVRRIINLRNVHYLRLVLNSIRDRGWSATYHRIRIEIRSRLGG